MKKLFLLLFAFVAVSITVQAGDVTEQEALLKAQQFMKGKTFKQKTLRRAPQRNATKKNAPYYVFNAEGNDGFVIVSGDDRTEAILGYSDKGSLDMDNLPPNLKGWLEEYEKQIKAIEGSTNTVRRAPLRTTSSTPKVPIEPLITTQWGQGSPYNNLCPEIDGEHCVTGCIATAMAQVMYYHKWPQNACAAIPEYTTGKRQIEMPALPPTTFKWSAMRDRYFEGEQGENADAVAELMRYCGQAVKMDYDVGASGVFVVRPRHFIQYFGYSKNAKYISMSQYTMSQWEDILYKELSEGRPIMYEGFNKSSGHEFILDGYDGDGYFHFSWGWEGSSDGYYLLSILDCGWNGVYNRSQAAIIGLQPDNGETAIPYIYGYHGGDLAQTNYSRRSESENFPEISLTNGVSIQYEIEEEQDFSLEYGLGLYKDTQLLTVLDQSSTVLNSNNRTVYKQTNIAFGKNLEDGIYQIRSIYKLPGDNDWQACSDSYINYIVAIISSNNLTLNTVSETDTQNATYTVNNVVVSHHEVTVNITNTGNTNQEMLYLRCTNAEGRSWTEVVCGAIESGKSGDVIFPSLLSCEGVCSAVISADMGFTRIMWKGELSFPERVEQQLRCSNMSIANYDYDNNVLRDSKLHVTVTITNTGENIFNDEICCNVYLASHPYSNGYSGVYSELQPVLLDIGETKEIEFAISPLENNREYLLMISYYGKDIKDMDGGKFFLVAKNSIEYEGLTFAYSPNSKTASVIPGHYQELKSVTVPSIITVDGTDYSVTEIASNAFKSCHIKSITIPEGVVAIGNMAFGWYSDLENISLPSTLKSIGNYAFQGSKLKEISIPEGVNSIGLGAFGDCSKLETIKLPSTLKLIGREAIISGCDNLKYVYSAMIDPIEVAEKTFSLKTGEFDPIPPHATLYVPEGSVSKYQEAIGWNIFPKIVEIGTETITVTVKDASRKYGDANPAFEYEISGGTEVLLGGALELTCEAVATSAVGEYAIKAAKGTATYPNIVFVNGTLTVTKAPLTINGGSYTMKQGDNLPAFTPTYSGFKNNETEAVLTTKPTLTTEATSASEPGEYEVTVSGAEAQNYEITYETGRLTIGEADAITLTAKSYTIKYGDALPEFEFTSEGAALDGTPSISCEATSASPVGTYPIVITKGSVTNYNDHYVNGTLTIEKAPLTISAGTYTMKQGDNLPAFTPTYTGFKNGETEEVLTTKPTLTTEATSASEPGEYEVTVSGAEAANYEITYEPGTLTIAEADPITVIVKNASREYGDENPVFEYEISGGTEEQLGGALELTCEAVATSAVGEYAIKAAKGTATYPNIVFVDGTLTIEKASLTISGGTYTIKQGEDLPAFTATYSGFKNGETEEVLTAKPMLTTEATSASEPGEYEVTVSGAEAANYEITYEAGTLTITEASGIQTFFNENDNVNDSWYTIDGRKLQGKPTQKGVYIRNGAKVVIK